MTERPPATGGASARARSGRLGALTACVLILASGLALEPDPASARGASEPLRVLGFLPHPPKAPENIGSYGPYFFDPENRRLYTVYDGGQPYQTHLVEFDLDRWPIPRLVRDVGLGVVILGAERPGQAAVDSDRRRAFVLSADQAFVGGVQVIDLRTLKAGAFWSLRDRVPGFVPLGITYHPGDDRLYLVGQQTGNAQAEAISAVVRPAAPTVVVALDAATGDVAWARGVPQCQEVMNTAGDGAFIARSTNLPALYFACIRPLEYPGESGIVRLWIDPDATATQAAASRLEFFPISGDYTFGAEGITGFAAMDYASERFYLLSQTISTPGSWVFDGKLSAWVGFIAATDQDARGLGIDQGNGHVYIRSGSEGELILADGRSTPVQQGIHVAYDPWPGFYVIDPLTHRAFIWTSVKDRTVDGGLRGRIGVLLDQTPKAEPPSPPDYDALTSDVAEGANAFTDFSGGVNGFGARAYLVGGLRAVNEAADAAETTVGGALPIPKLHRGDQGLTAARAAWMDLRPAGASASAQASVPDAATMADLADLQNQVREDGAEEGPQPWPYPAVSCLDAGGNAVEMDETGPGGEARSRCDVADFVAETSSSFGAVTAENVAIASTAFHGKTWREPDVGVATQTTAIAQGVRLSASGSGSVAIAEVRTEVFTVAHGRPGTSRAVWERRIAGVSIRNASGETVQQVPGCVTRLEAEASRGPRAGDDPCAPVARAINDALGVRMRVDLPVPEVVATPKGAFAGVHQTDADYYQGQTVYDQGTAFPDESLGQRPVPALQVVVFNDSAERSRLVVQLAGVQADSIYTVTSLEPFPPPDPTDDPVPGGSSGGGDGEPTGAVAGSGGTTASGGAGSGSAPVAAGGDEASGAAGSASTGPAPVGTGPARIAAGIGFLIRSPRDALLTAGLWLLFAGALAGLHRRRVLLHFLERNR